MISFPYSKIISSEEETINLAKEFAGVFGEGDIICLNGNLGSGKTFFVKNFCKEFGVKNVSSPSFAIVNEYISKTKFIHFDFYRIKKVEELFDIGFEDYLSDRDSIVFIEWAEMYPEILPKHYYEIRISVKNETQREFTILKK